MPVEKQFFDQHEQVGVFKDFMRVTFLAVFVIVGLGFRGRVVGSVAGKFAGDCGFVSAEYFGNLAKTHSLSSMNKQ